MVPVFPETGCPLPKEHMRQLSMELYGASFMPPLRTSNTCARPTISPNAAGSAPVIQTCAPSADNASYNAARRAALYDALANLGAQVWMTGADPAAFGDIVGRAQVFEVRPGAVEPRH